MKSRPASAAPASFLHVIRRKYLPIPLNRGMDFCHAAQNLRTLDVYMDVWSLNVRGAVAPGAAPQVIRQVLVADDGSSADLGLARRDVCMGMKMDLRAPGHFPRPDSIGLHGFQGRDPILFPQS